MKLWSSSVLVLGVAVCGERASAQSYSQTQFDIQHAINLPPTPIIGTNVVEAEFFSHVWRQPINGSGAVPTWETAPPWPSPPIWPSNTQQQPAGFDPFATEQIVVGTLSNSWKVSHPRNYCLPYYAAAHPCVFNPWPPASGNPISLGHGYVPDTGTGPSPGWFTQIGIASIPSTGAESQLEVQPFSMGSGALSATIRSAGQYHTDWTWDQTYAFAWTQLGVTRRFATQPSPPGIPIPWDLVTMNMNVLPPAPQYLPLASLIPTIFYDPVRFVATELSSNTTYSGELFSLSVELTVGGWCNGGHGFLALDTPRGGVRVRMEHPFINPRGSLDVEIENGVVVTSRATGYFASMSLPPVGTSGPIALNFPSPTFDMYFDASSKISGAYDLQLMMGGAGGDVRPDFVATGACCVNGACTPGMTQAQCSVAGGTWQGANTGCPNVPYYAEEFRGGFEDIASFGTPSSAGACDDCGQAAVPLSFNFNYFGSTQSSVNIASNGYLTFGGVLNDYQNQTIPSASGPNAMIAGYWDDLDPSAAGDVHYATLGVAPNRRFIAQWTGVPHYNTNNVDDPLHTFQIVLHEGSNVIETVYLDAPQPDSEITPTVGIENALGTAGLAIDPQSLTPKGSRRFVPASSVTCPNGSATPYCTSGTTTNGCAATMGAVGTPSVSQSSGFSVTCGGVEGQKQGILFYGISGTTAQPWGPGSSSFLCVKAPFQRSSTVNTGGGLNQCNGAMSLDLLAYAASHPSALGVPFFAGQQCWSQAWFRDPPAPKTTSLSNGLAITFVP